MKRKLILIIAMAGLTIVTLTIGAWNNGLTNSTKRPGSILGTWKGASYKYGTSASNFIDFPKNESHIKLITENYFTWVTVDTTTRIVTSMAGGKYTLSGNTYTESIDYGLGMDRYLRNNQKFTIKVEGNMFYLSGTLNDGYKIEEIWERVK